MTEKKDSVIEKLTPDELSDMVGVSQAGSCVAGRTWGKGEKGNVHFTGEHLNRTIEKNIGHIFVVSRKLLGEFLELVEAFYED